jgi:hypothetical protein
MAKAANKAKASSAASKKKPAAPAKKGKGKSKETPKSQLTWLAKGLLAGTFLWFLFSGFLATSDLMARRANCIDWLVEQSRAVQGYKRVFNTDSARFGCSLQKLGLRGFIAEPPIYPNIEGLILIFSPPLGVVAFYLLAFRFRRGWILRGKKKVWAKTGPMDLDDFEDMRNLPDEEEIAAMDEADAAENRTTAEAMNDALEDAAQKTAPASKLTAKPAKTATVKPASKAAAKPSSKAPAEPEEPKEEMSELDKILRQVDD